MKKTSTRLNEKSSTWRKTHFILPLFSFHAMKLRNRFEQERFMWKKIWISFMRYTKYDGRQSNNNVALQGESINSHFLFVYPVDCSPNNSPAFLINDMHKFFFPSDAHTMRLSTVERFYLKSQQVRDASIFGVFAAFSMRWASQSLLYRSRFFAGWNFFLRKQAGNIHVIICISPI